MDRPDPKSLLAKVNTEEKKNKKGQLKIFFGYAAGVGKTYSMLESAQSLKKSGIDVVVGYIEPHTRPETLALLDGLEIIELKIIQYKSIELKEFDLDKALKRNPQVILVDEFAHTNAKGVRHNKRWQDIEEILASGIDVYTTVNVQHLESLNDIVEIITNVSVKETIPDKFLDNTTQLELIDIEPDALLERFNDGKIYKLEQAKRAQENFFIKDNLIALREIALRKTAEKVNKEVEITRLSKGEVAVVPTCETLLACISPSPSSTKVIRTASRIASSNVSNWIVLYIENPNLKLDKSQKKQLNINISLAKELGAEVIISHGEDVVEQILRFSKMRNVTKIVIGKNHYKNKKFYQMLKRDLVDRLIDEVEYIDVHVIPYKKGSIKSYENKKEKSFLSRFKISKVDFLKLALITLFTTFLVNIIYKLGFSKDNILLIFMLGVVLVSTFTKGYSTGIVSSIVNILIVNFLFTSPIYTLNIDNPSYIITLIVFSVVGIITSTLTSRIQQQMEIYCKREGDAQMLYQISRSFSRLFIKEDIINKGLDLLFISLNRSIICYVPKNEKELKSQSKFINSTDSILNDKDEKAVANWVFTNASVAGNNTNTLPGAKGYYMPIVGIESTLGVIGIDCEEKKLNNEEICVIEAIIAQMSIALDREKRVIKKI
ncbi:DUF4118 domain-containing protein [Romboutsia lituseburensis]|uniref:Two-component system, OmpR family, sensor histidine kinase KdpD n=1 Tax=Romboutsia lituseburensis DSM 797 TaxID=1121325 RepID=A0A1G9M3M3_9FIRM|nr:DUF4118 domain-containing protein [Romboutsia lituseburensis]CEH34630.1 Sensor protein KdpD [Romboutsia lituseburensis]SDL68882.1 two-component system, OmpR family, sensor histidine kinase KdpD [Romboutsia lituseburensis DSM 797]